MSATFAVYDNGDVELVPRRCQNCNHDLDLHDPFDVTHSFSPRGACMADGCECSYFEPLSGDEMTAIANAEIDRINMERVRFSE